MEALEQQLKKKNMNQSIGKGVQPLSGVLGNQSMLMNYRTNGDSIQRKLKPEEGAEEETLLKDSILYHGSSASLDAFSSGIDITKTTQKQLGDGFYTSQDKKVAEDYAGNLFKIKAKRNLIGQKIPHSKEMKSISIKTPEEINFFKRADIGNDFLHTSAGTFEGTTIYEQHKLTSAGVTENSVTIEADAPPLAPAVVPSAPDKLTSYVPSGKKVKAVPKTLAMRFEPKPKTK